MLKAVLFDLDGTVLDTLPDLNACMNEALAVYGFPPITLRETMAYVGHGGRNFALAALPADKKGMVDEFYASYYEIHVRCKNEHTRPFAGEAECMAALRAAGMRLAVLTNKSQRAADVLGATLLNAGMRSVSVLWGYRSRAELLAAGAERFASSFDELRGILLAME